MFDRHSIVRTITTTVSLLVLAGLLGRAPVAVAQERFPTDRDAAIAAYETTSDKWAEGPVQYLMLPAEHETWRGLTTAAERQAFIRWFWERRNEDPRGQVNPTREAFYQRVAEANHRFAGLFPKGWKSDPGIVWVVLGRPDSIHSDGLTIVVWSYYTQGRHRSFTNAYGEMQVAFIESGAGKQEVVGDLSVGTFPFYLQQAFDYTREAMIVNQDLKFRSTTSGSG